MKKTRIIYSLCLGFASLVICTGVVYAATHDVTSILGGKSGDFFDVKGTMMFDSIKVGRQGTGGVTFFNGTIINNTTGTGNADNPVTFGDNVRIDGRIYRGATAGTGDSLPLLINDNMEVAGSLTIGSLASIGVIATGNLTDSAVTTAKIADGTIATADLSDSAVTTAKISDGTIATADLASGSVTQAVENNTSNVTTTKSGNLNYDIATQVQITTGNSKLFCMFNGYGSIDTPDTTMAIALVYDGAYILNSYREATIGHDNVGHVILATSAIIDATAGSHTVQLGWNTSAGTTATIYFDTLDCLELKK